MVIFINRYGNKYVTWTMLKWIKIALQYWNNEISYESNHRESNEYQFHATLSISPDYGLPESNIATSIQNSAITNKISNSTIGSAIGTIGSTAIGIGTVPLSIATSAIENVTNMSSYYQVTAWTGIVILSLNKPYQLEVYDINSKVLLNSFNIKDMLTIQLSIDSTEPLDYGLILDIVSCDYNDGTTDRDTKTQEKSSPLSVSPRNLKDEDFGPKGIIGFRRFLRKTAYKTSVAIQSSAGKVTDTVLGATSGAVSTVSSVATNTAKVFVATAANAARTVATGDPRIAISSAQRTVFGYGKDLVNLVASTGVIFHGFWDNTVTYLVIKHASKAYYAIIPTYSSFLWDSRVIIDIQHSTIKILLSDIENSTPLNTKDSVDIFLYHGVIGSESLISQRNIKISKFISKFKSIPISPIDHTTLSSDMKVTLHSELGLYLSILSGKGLMLPQQGKVGGIFVKCKLVDMKGKSVYVSSTSNKETKHTKTVPTSTAPVWDGDGDQIFLKAMDGLDRAYFVRLQILGGLAVNPDILGFVLIPIEDFTTTIEEKVYSVMKYKRTTGIGGHGGSYGLGEIRVKIQKVVDRTFTSPNATIKPNSIHVIPSLFKNIVHKTFYPCEGILSGNIDNYTGMGGVMNSISVESMFLSVASADYLLLIDTDMVTSVTESDSRNENISTTSTTAIPMTDAICDTFSFTNNSNHINNSNINNNANNSNSNSNSNSNNPSTPIRNRSDRDMSTSSMDSNIISVDGNDINLSISQNKRKSYRNNILNTNQINEKIGSIDALGSIEFVIFENQRRQLYPPYDWSNGNLFRNERKQFSDESGEKNFTIDSLASVIPPDGYEWYSDWITDKKYTSTDEYGWTYGFHFNDIMNNYGNGIASISPTLRTVRRRKWVRSARPIHLNATLSSSSCSTWNNTNTSSLSSKSSVSSMSSIRKNSLSPSRTAAVVITVDSSNIDNNLASTSIESKISDGNNINSNITIGEQKAPIQRRGSALKLPKSTADQIPSDWRQEKYFSRKNTGTYILSTCQERLYPGSPIKILYSSINETHVITPGILSLRITINRYFGQDSSINRSSSANNSNSKVDELNSSSDEIYHKADVDIFIFNCPSAELKTFIDERIQFDKFRTKVKDIISSGTTLGLQGHKLSNADESIVPDTVELSYGAETMANLDRDATILDRKATEIYSSTIQSNPIPSLVLALNTEKSDFIPSNTIPSNNIPSFVISEDLVIISKRALRLRLYQASLLAANLILPSFTFTEDSANYIVNEDLKSVDLIIQEDDVSTVNNRIEYLLDIAEARIRDAALCGWNYRDRQLLQVLEIFTNRYLFEMVNLLSKFFNMKNMQMLKGLQSKITLISTFTSHNDRLSDILTMALKPYDNLLVKPKPQLSLFLAFGQLLSWYAVVLQQDMKRVVYNALSVWRNKNAAGRGDQYSYPLPWIPMRKKGNTGPFLSLLPEDTANYLNKYLEFARLRKEDMAESLIASISEVDNKIALSYAISFQVLAEAYWYEISNKKWNSLIFSIGDSSVNRNSSSSSSSSSSGNSGNSSNINKDKDNMDEEEGINELIEQSEWLCSVANDACRVVDETLINSELDKQSSIKSSDSNYIYLYDQEVREVIANSYNILSKTRTRALDYLSCIIFYEVCYHFTPYYPNDQTNIDNSMNNISLLDDKFYLVWEKYAINHYMISGYDSPNRNQAKFSSLMESYINELKEVLSTKIDCLDKLNFLQLLKICIEKVIIRFFYLLRDLHRDGRHYSPDSSVIGCFVSDKNFTMISFIELLEITSYGKEYKDSIITSFQRLDQVITLLTAESENSMEFIQTLKSLEKIASGRPTEAFAIAELMSVCMDLRNHGIEGSNNNNTTSGSSSGSGNLSHIHKRPSATNKGKGTERRGSLLSGMMSAMHSATTAATGTSSSMDQDIAKQLSTATHSIKQSVASPAMQVIENIRDMMDPNDMLSIEEYERILCNPTIEYSPSDGFSLVSPIEKVFYLSDFKDTSQRVFNLKSFVLDSIYHSQGNIGTIHTAVSSYNSPVKYIQSLLRIGSYGNSYNSSSYNNNGNNSNDNSNMNVTSNTSNISNDMIGSVLTDRIGTMPTESTTTIVIIGKIKAYNLLCLDIGRKPSTYITVSIPDSFQSSSSSSSSFNHKSTIVKKDTMDPDWSLDEPIYLPVNSASVSSKKLLVTIYYKNRWYSDESIGSVEIQLLTLDISPIENKDFEIDISSASARAKQVYALLSQHGVPLPKLRLSVSIQNQLSR